jgi:hypothetical protein
MPSKLTCAALVGLAMSAPLAGCGSEAAGAGVAVRDSAGIQIVENGPIKELPPAFLISPTPRLDLGGAKDSPDHELDPRAPFLRAARLSDGGFAVSDWSTVKVFDANGRYVSTVGRSGDGPGEFRQLRAVCVAPGDTIIALGYAAPRVSVFDREGNHVRTFNVKDGYVEGSGCFEDGSLLIHSHARPNPESVLTPENAKVLDRINTVRLLAPDGSVLGIVGDFPAESGSLIFPTIANRVPYGDLVYVGNGQRPEIRVYTRKGALVRIIRWQQSLIPVTDELLKERVMAREPRGTPSSVGERRLEFFRGMPQPATIAAYFNLKVDDAGRIWVQDHPLNGPAHGWTVLDSTGRALGRVSLPEIPGARGIEFESASDHEVQLVWRDEENGFAHLTFHELGPVEGGK